MGFASRRTYERALASPHKVEPLGRHTRLPHGGRVVPPGFGSKKKPGTRAPCRAPSPLWKPPSWCGRNGDALADVLSELRCRRSQDRPSGGRRPWAVQPREVPWLCVGERGSASTAGTGSTPCSRAPELPLRTDAQSAPPRFRRLGTRLTSRQHPAGATPSPAAAPTGCHSGSSPRRAGSPGRNTAAQPSSSGPLAKRRLPHVEYLELDFGDPLSIVRCAEQAAAVDVLVNNAGETEPAALPESPRGAPRLG